MKTQISTPHTSLRLIYTLVIVIIFGFTSCSTEPIAASDDLYENNEISEEEAVEPTADVTAFEQDVFDAINKHRGSLGMSSLEFSTHAFVQAKEHSQYMVEQGSLSHNNFGNRARAISESTGAKTVAENVARNYDSASAVLEAWLSSPSHRSTLEGDYSHSALSVAYDKDGNAYYTHIFFKK